MNKLYIIFLVATLIISACEKDILQQNEPEELIVLEAYLYADEPVNDIYLTSILAYGGEDTVFQTVSDAEIKIIHDGISYLLVPSDSIGYYNYPGDDLFISIGENYHIEFDYYGKTTTAETSVPEPPTGITISDEKIYIDEEELQANPRTFMQNLPEITLSWNESTDDYFYVLVENIEENPVNIDLGDVGEKFNNFKFISRPVQMNSFILMPMVIIQQYGTHLIRVFRVNKEYADLYESIDQDSRNLNEPLTNINNGLGIFTAFSCDSIYLDVVKQ